MAVRCARACAWSSPDRCHPGRRVPRRHADHARRRRVHRQRRPARDRRAVAPLARAWTSRKTPAPPRSASTPAASSPSAAAGSKLTSAARTSSTSAWTRAAASPSPRFIRALSAGVHHQRRHHQAVLRDRVRGNSAARRRASCATGTAAEEIVDRETGEIIVAAGQQITDDLHSAHHRPGPQAHARHHQDG